MEIEEDHLGEPSARAAALPPPPPPPPPTRGDAATPRGTMQSTLGDLWGDVTEMLSGVSQEVGTRPPGGLWRGRRKAALGLVLIAVAIALMLIPSGRRRAPQAGDAPRCGCAGACG
jgi:hypothetical protein